MTECKFHQMLTIISVKSEDGVEIYRKEECPHCGEVKNYIDPSKMDVLTDLSEQPKKP